MRDLQKIKRKLRILIIKIIESFYHQFLRLLLSLLRTGPGLLPDLPVVTEQHIETPRHFSLPSDTSDRLSPTGLNCRARSARDNPARGEKLRHWARKMKDCLIFLVDNQTGGAIHLILKCIFQPPWAFYVFAWMLMLFYVRIFPVKMKINQPKQTPASGLRRMME